jgi:large subunit ribosomal protein L35
MTVLFVFCLTAEKGEGGVIFYFQFNKKEESVPKIKTNRGAAKRFKKTGTGKIKAKRAFARHILTKKSSNRKRVFRTSKFMEKSDAKKARMLVPYL